MANQVEQYATTSKQVRCSRLSWSRIIAASSLSVATVEAIEVTPSHTVNAPRSAGVHKRVMSGATSSGSACAATVPVKTVVACLQKTGTEESMFGYKSIASRIRDGCTNGKKQKAGEKKYQDRLSFFRTFPN
jgi:hypothetical protein